MKPDAAQRRWLERNPSGAAELAQFLSMASLIDPGLLRAARVELGLRVSAEIELSLSPILSSSSAHGLVLHPNVLPEMRDALKDSGLKDRAWKMMEERQSALSPALVLEERLVWQWMRGEAGEAMDAELNLALASIVRDGKTQMAGWAAHALPRLPEMLRESRSARYLASAVEAHGYRNAAVVGAASVPPSWMRPGAGRGGARASVAFFGKEARFSSPVVAGEAAFDLPADGRVWVRWWSDGAERTRILNLAAERFSVRVEMEAAEFTVAAPGMPTVLMKDAEVVADRAGVLVELIGDGGGLAAYLSRELGMRGFEVQVRPAVGEGFPDRETEAQKRLRIGKEAVLVVLEGGRDPLLRKAVELAINNCVPTVMLEGDEGTKEILQWADLVLPREPQGRFYRLRERLVEYLQDELPYAGQLFGFPLMPWYISRRKELFDTMHRALMEGYSVNVVASPGMGGRMAVLDVVRDKYLRRHFHGGIFWYGAGVLQPDDEKRWLVVADVRDLQDGWPGMKGTVLLLSEEPVETTDREMVRVDGNHWTDREISSFLFRTLHHAFTEYFPDETLLSMAPFSPYKIKQLDRLVTVAMRTGSIDWGALAGELAGDLRRLQRIGEALRYVDDLIPLAACPPAWNMPSLRDKIWDRYFGPVLVRPAGQYLQDLFPNRQVPEEISTALVELARPTHQRIVDTFELECGGDWPMLKDEDGYATQYLPYHMKIAYPERIRELDDNLDWLLRMGLWNERQRSSQGASK